MLPALMYTLGLILGRPVVGKSRNLSYIMQTGQPGNAVKVRIKTDQEVHLEFLAGQGDQGIVEVERAMVLAAKAYNLRKPLLRSTGNPGDVRRWNHRQESIKQSVELLRALLLFGAPSENPDSLVKHAVKVDQLALRFDQCCPHGHCGAVPRVPIIHQRDDDIRTKGYQSRS
jgi:hypothetical protein